MKIVSACLCGFPCRYDGRSKPDPEIAALFANGEVLPVCPEQLGGLCCPRPPAEIREGDGEAVLQGRARVCTEDGTDVTEAFLSGARRALAAAEECGAQEAILKSRSPSCGRGEIYDGSFSGTLKTGDGVFAALLRQHGIRVRTR